MVAALEIVNFFFKKGHFGEVEKAFSSEKLEVYLSPATIKYVHENTGYIHP